MINIIIDIRSREKYLVGHINGAINIPYNELFINYDKYLNKTTRYLIYCESGNKSSDIVSYLNSHGYNCVNLDGGYHKNNYI